MYRTSCLAAALLLGAAGTMTCADPLAERDAPSRLRVAADALELAGPHAAPRSAANDTTAPLDHVASPPERTWLEEPGLEGARTFEARRGQLLGRAKGEPVVFLRTPGYDEHVSDVVRVYRARITSTRHPWDVLRQLLPTFAANPEVGRQTLLREGYLFATDPDLAYALLALVRPQHLFATQRLWIQRGAATYHAVRSGGMYVYADGPEAGQPVRLLFLDRVGPGAEPDQPPLHRDLRALRHELGFDRVRVRHLTDDHVIADLRYGGTHWVETVLRSDGARLRLAADPTDEGGADRAVLDRARWRMGALAPVLEAMKLGMAERLPFDEPRREIGQEDGKLRRSWQYAYLAGRESFRVRQERYPVFDASGRAWVPQVCVDFLLDSFERASGAWWRGRGEFPGKTPGRLDFDEFLPRDELRRATGFLEFARARPEWFSVHEFPAEERIPLGQKDRFFAYLSDRADEFEAGDMIFVRGVTPWDKVVEHMHSFFIYETDPVSGVPIAIAGNPGIASLWSWESEARRAPERTLQYRVRPTEALLARVSGLSPGVPPPRTAPIGVPPLLAD